MSQPQLQKQEEYPTADDEELDDNTLSSKLNSFPEP
jgi:hypothetical protein